MFAPAGIGERRPTGYVLRAADGVVVADSTPATVLADLTAVVQVRGAMEQFAHDRSSGCGQTQTDGYDAIEARFCKALGDASVGRVVLDVFSPGGDVPGLEQTSLRMRAAVEASGKPCIGYVNEFAASAALWLMLVVCDATFIPPSGRMGSVGSCVLFRTEARKLAEEGTDVYIARQPDGKYRPNGMEPLDEIGKARLDRQAVIGEAAFVNTISAVREISPETIRSWNGAIFDGADAVSVGLADRVGSLDDAVKFAREMSGVRAAA
jgi:ClpP class serine protease